MRLKMVAAMMAVGFVTHIGKSQADSAVNLDAMTVTGERNQQSVLEQPVSIGYKKQAELQLDNAANEKDLFNSIAGVRISQTGSPIGHETSIRLPTNTGPYYLYLQDGIPVQSSGFFNHNGLAYTNFTTAGSVEVLKGAGTALYGSDAVAATINVISAPERDQLGLKMLAEGGSDGFRRFLLSGGTDIDAYSTITAQASHTGADGWRDHTKYDREEVGVKYINDLDYNNTIKIGFTANKTVGQMAGDLVGKEAFKHETTSVGNVQSALDSGLDIERKFDFARVSIEWKHDISNTFSVDSIAYLRSNRNRYIATWEKNLPQNDSKQNTFGLLFKTNASFGKLRNLSGLDFEYTKASQLYIQEFDSGSVPAGKIYDYDIDYMALAPYTRFEYQMTDKLKLGAGVRYDTNRYEYTNNTADGQYASSSYLRVASGNDHQYSHLSPKLDLTYQLDDSQMVYARYANGFRIPQASTLYNLKTNNTSFSIDDEKTNTYEVGYKWITDSNEFASSLYLLTIDDTIVQRTNSKGDKYYVNGGKTLHRGIELSLTSKLTDEFKSKIAYSYSKHEFDNDAVYGDNEEAAAPRTIANVRLIYSPKRIAGLTTMLEWEHVGSYWMDDANTTKYDGYDLANFKMRYALNKHLDLFARVTNLTNRLYAENASINYGTQRYTPGAPRQAYVGFDYKL